MPAGRFVRTQSYNWGMALDRDQSRAVLISSDALSLVELGDTLKVERIPPYGFKRERGRRTQLV